MRAPASTLLAPAIVGSLLATLGAAGCTNDPVYLPSPLRLEGGMVDMDGNPIPASASLAVPVVLETMEDALERAALQMRYPDIEIPYVRVGDLALSVEWTVTNLTDTDGTAVVQLNGANQFFAYDPTAVMGEVPADDEAPPMPGLAGETPWTVPAGGTLSGLFREDELREASIDLDQITRGNYHPFRARLTISKNVDSYDQLSPITFDEDGEALPQMSTGVVIPAEAIPQLLRVDLVFTPDRPMTLDFTIRVRDVRGELLPDLLLEAPPEELEPLAPAPFAFTAPAPPA